MRVVLIAFVWSLCVLTAEAGSPFDVAVECIKRYEGLHGPGHHPYVGYGHRLLPGERFNTGMTEGCADSLLRADLRQKCRVFRSFGQDSLLLGVLAYNVGETRVLKSGLAGMLKRGCRDIYADYLSFCRIKGRVSERLKKRRAEEFNLLYSKE